ncbi:hypothetical protein Plano_1490 [Planococcus sp. PAMC 21323]|uniref:putative immunity protein n=1 Tax=Planococcus sp. PAMC 21323 TaxID=1526927 RepID=UPI00058643B3|nr:hypothetical protein [Planococcus sp. PAMC 21323]AIY05455.1 hypothetical protein Plano_1490 [Planococcus sp. PAMC 21323]
MISKPKIKIVDDMKLRNEIVDNTELLDQIELAKWAIDAAERVLPYLEQEFPQDEKVLNGIRIIELWQNQEATVHQVRKAGFKVHELARECKKETAKAAARAIGHAIAVGHMRGHAMVATDYVIKTMNLAFNNELNKATEEREWQLHRLHKFIQDCKFE